MDLAEKIIDSYLAEREGDVRIEYGAVPNKNEHKGGFLPVIWVNGRMKGATFSSRGYAFDQAVKYAEDDAHAEADHYGGDWNISIVPKR